MAIEPFCVLAVDVDPDHFPNGDDACLTAGLFLARRLSAYLEQHGHEIPPEVAGGVADDAWITLRSQRDDVEYRFTIVFFPESGRDYRMAIQYGVHVGFWRRLFRGTPQLAADDPLHALLQDFGARFPASELLTDAEFAKRY
jgi:hypothetical protein